MRNYKIAVTVRHSGRYIEHELGAMSISDAFCLFTYWLGMTHQVGVDALGELDITETGESE